uniref:UDP-glucuronosyltransferase n=1 Tax=Megaselia scalaris TaxID=36166 RepID=T1H5D9_MEGSC
MLDKTCCNLIKVINLRKRGVFSSPSKSHYFVGFSLMKGLANKGHEVTIIAPFKERNPVKNLKTIFIKETVPYFEEFKKDTVNLRNAGILQTISDFYNFGVNITRLTLENEGVQELLNSNETFDLLICEMMLDEAYLGFAHRFKTPIVATSSFGSNQWTNDLVGTPSPLSYVPNTFLSFPSRMTLLQRIGNLALTHFDRIYFDFFYFHKQSAVYDEIFSNPKPSLEELYKNVSLVLLNTHFSLASPLPYVPNMIEVGGLQVNTETKDLPLEMKLFVQSAEHGVIYFSMGSNVESTTLPKEKRDAILNAFRSLKQKVLWKWEDPNLPGKPDNVFISPWFPQDDVLAHPNVIAFITHGGLLSTTESIYHGVPIIGIPMFGDQFLNMAQAVNGGYGLIADYNLLN